MTAYLHEHTLIMWKNSLHLDRRTPNIWWLRLQPTKSIGKSGTGNMPGLNRLM